MLVQCIQRLPEKRRRMFHMWDGLTEPVAQVEETPAAEDTTVVAATLKDRQTSCHGRANLN
jgi:hypothetical protein